MLTRSYKWNELDDNKDAQYCVLLHCVDCAKLHRTIIRAVRQPDTNHLGRRKYYSNCTLIRINFKSLQHRTFYRGM